ncbi:T7SS effector LXG polymorphic toxin [Latilactobacillus fuchuensis]|uniref:T7SS effector LXG polymorphic toxin n=2 Tax=Latilactobacillus fuchuensis TaxID=164393 RepID=UPI0039AF9DC0
MAKLYYEKLTDYQKRATDGLKRRTEKLEQLKTALQNLATSENFQGTAATNITAYLQEVHINGMINGLLQAVDNLQQTLDFYVIGYPAVDQNGVVFKLIDDDLAKHQTEVANRSRDYHKILTSATKTMTKVEHIKATSGLAKVTKNSSAVIDNLATMKKLAFDQQTDWHRYESDHANDFATLDTLIGQLNSLVGQYAGGTVPTMADYQGGGFNLVAGEQYTNALASVSAMNQSRAAADKQARQSLSQIRTSQKQYEKAVAKQKKTEIANKKKQAEKSFWLDLGFLVGGVVVGILTGGLGAAPLLMMAPGLIFQMSDLYEAGTAAFSDNGKGKNYLKELARPILGKNTDTVYESTEFVANLVGAGGAYKQLAKEGVLTAAKSEAKPILKTFIKEDATAALKAVKGNVSAVKPQWFFKQGIKPKSGVLFESMKENGAVVGKSTIITKIGKTYAQEGLRQVTYDTVAKPIVSAISNKVADGLSTQIMGDNKSDSLTSMAINKTINKSVNKGITKVTKAKKISDQTVNTTTNAVDDLVKSSSKGESPKVAQRVINNYREMAEHGYQASSLDSAKNIINSFYRSYAEMGN